MSKALACSIELGSVRPNIGDLLLANREKFAKTSAFAQKVSHRFQYWSWNELVMDTLKVAQFFEEQGLPKGSRVAFITGNSYERLICEMAVMGLGLVSVPIFSGYPSELLEQLLRFSKVDVIVAERLNKLPKKIAESTKVILLDEESNVEANFDFEGSRCWSLPSLLSTQKLDEQKIIQRFCNVNPGDLAMIMYTSGTSSFPKGVMLTHHNILSQQRALELLWGPKPGMKFLCYLPWHHSFGGLFERFFALSSGGCLAIDDSFGKNIDKLMANFKEIQPTVYFSVPKVYQEIINRVLASKEAEDQFFHANLQFVFTAAAPLPSSISDIFKQKEVPVVEGWGLTETSPCCTLTGFSLDRDPGVVGFPIPGVAVRLAEDEEILVKGPNVMMGYFERPDLSQKVLSSEGWFHTGDVGEIEKGGLRIVSRKDRVFKLSNGEKVYPTALEETLRGRCKFIKHAFVFGSGQKHPLALVFPNFELLGTEKLSLLEQRDCENPGCSDQLSGCLRGCLDEVNENSDAGFERIKKMLVIEGELDFEKNELTPSFKLVPRNVEKNYWRHIEYLLELKGEAPKGSYLIDTSGARQ